MRAQDSERGDFSTTEKMEKELTRETQSSWKIWGCIGEDRRFPRIQEWGLQPGNLVTKEDSTQNLLYHQSSSCHLLYSY